MENKYFLKVDFPGGVQWRGIHLPMQGTPVRVPQLLGLPSRAGVLRLLKLMHLEPVFPSKRTHCTSQLESSPNSLQLEKSLRAATKTQHSQK